MTMKILRMMKKISLTTPIPKIEDDEDDKVVNKILTFRRKEE